MKVHYFLRGDRYWGDVLDETESHIVMDRLRHEGIVLHLNTQVKEAHGKKGQLTEVETQAGEVIPCQVLAVAIGVRPRVDLAKQAGLTVDKAIVVDRYMRTSRPEIFAAGDAAQVGKTPLDVLWPTALDQGRVAGANMAGGNVSYVKAVACNVTMLTGLKVTIIGNVGRKKEGAKDADLVAIARGDSEAWRLTPNALVFANRDDVNRVRLFVGDKKIVGALVMGDQSWSRPLQRLIAAEADISPIRSALLGEESDGLSHLAEFYKQWDEARNRPAMGILEKV
jgi:NAD(P)H-nitrite reductase large subunit